MSSVVVFAGEYDLSCQKELRDELARLDSEASVALDFTQVTFIDSTCITEMARLGTTRQSAGLTPVGIAVKPGSAIRRLFDIIGIDQVFRVVESIDEILPKDAPVSVRYASSGCAGSARPPRASPGYWLG
jgi:anti-anti-sigma regulatory factor